MDSSIQKIVDEEISNLDNYDGNQKVSFSYRLTVNKADGTTKNYSEQTMLNYYQASNKDYNINFATKEDAEAALEAYKAIVIGPDDEIAPAGETLSFTVQPQASVTVMQHSTGEVVALSGGRGEKVGSRTLNRATSTVRQPGSAMKVITAYTAALDSKGRGLGSVADDTPFRYKDGPFVNNVDMNHYGLLTYREGIVQSNNIIAIRALTDAGTTTGFKYAKAYGLTTLVDGDNNQAMAIGGLTNGVKNIEMCGAYATIANHGYYIEPHLYTQVTDRQGNVLLDRTYNEEVQVIKETTAWLLTSAMQDVMKVGTGVRANFTLTYNTDMAVAGKSGTTNGKRDVVFTGFTPYYTAYVWGGFDDNSKQSYANHSKNIFREVMGRIHQNLPVAEFVAQPSDIIEVEICRKSGMLGIPGVCDMDPRGNMIYTEFYEEGTEPTEKCNRHAWLKMCDYTGFLGTESCPGTNRVYIIGGTQETADAEYSVSLEAVTHWCPYHDGYHEQGMPNVDGIVETELPEPDEEDEEGEETDEDEAELPDDYSVPGMEGLTGVQGPIVEVTEVPINNP